MRHRRRLRPFGARLVLAAEDQRVLDACDLALARYPRDAGIDAELDISCRIGQDGPDDPAWPTTTVRHGPGWLELRCGTANLTADIGSGRADIELPPALLACDDAVRMFVEGAVSTLLVGGGHLHAVHAGLVYVGGRWLLLRGPSGAGKSTLTYACLRAGAPIASDDWVYGVAGASPDWLWGYPWRMYLVPEATGRWPELLTAPTALHPGADRLKVPVVPPAAKRRLGGAVDAVVFLDPGETLALRPVGPEEARDLFWGPALPTERRDLPPAWVDALLDRPCAVLSRGPDPDAAATLLRRAALGESPTVVA